MKEYKANVKIGFALLGVMGMGASAIAQTCLTPAQYPDETPNSRYTVHGDGTVTDTETNLMWQRCSVGHLLIISSDLCGNTPLVPNIYTWQGALESATQANLAGLDGHQDWRLPNIKELRSIAKYNCENPAINEVIFPGTANSYWSASPYANVSDDAWQLNFSDGSDSADGRSSFRRVRLVRTGP